MWIVVGIVAGLWFMLLAPVLVVGTWFVVITVILGLADGTLWLLDRRWTRKWGATPAYRVRRGKDVDAKSGSGGPHITLEKAVSPQM